MSIKNEQIKADLKKYMNEELEIFLNGRQLGRLSTFENQLIKDKTFLGLSQSEIVTFILLNLPKLNKSLADALYFSQRADESQNIIADCFGGEVDKLYNNPNELYLQIAKQNITNSVDEAEIRFYSNNDKTLFIRRARHLQNANNLSKEEVRKLLQMHIHTQLAKSKSFTYIINNINFGDSPEYLSLAEKVQIALSSDSENVSLHRAKLKEESIDETILNLKFVNDPKQKEIAKQQLLSKGITPTDESIFEQTLINFSESERFVKLSTSRISLSPVYARFESKINSAKNHIRLLTVGAELKTTISNPENIAYANLRLKEKGITPNQDNTILYIISHLQNPNIKTPNSPQSILALINLTPANLSTSDETIKQVYSMIGKNLSPQELKDVKQLANQIASQKKNDGKTSAPTSRRTTTPPLRKQKLTENIKQVVCDYLSDPEEREKARIYMLSKRGEKDNFKITDEQLTDYMLAKIWTLNHGLCVRISDAKYIGDFGVGHTIEKLEFLGFKIDKAKTPAQINILDKIENIIRNPESRVQLIEELNATHPNIYIDQTLEGTEYSYLNDDVLKIYLASKLNLSTKFKTVEMEILNELGIADFYTSARNSNTTSLLYEYNYNRFMQLNGKIGIDENGQLINPKSIDLQTKLSAEDCEKYQTTNSCTLEDLLESTNLTNDEITQIVKNGSIGGIDRQFCGQRTLVDLSIPFGRNLDYTIAIVLKRNREISNRTKSAKKPFAKRMTDEQIKELRRTIDERMNEFLNSLDKTAETSFTLSRLVVNKYLQICKDVYAENFQDNAQELKSM